MIIHADQFGVKSGKGHDNTLAVIFALEHSRQFEQAELVFPKGEYHFYPDQAHEKQLFISNHDQEGLRRIAFPIFQMNNLTVDGQGSEFIFHGPMIPFVVEDSNHIVIKNLVIDWEQPMFAQGIVTRSDADSFDVQMSPHQPYRLERNRIQFKFGKWEPVWGMNEFDPNTNAPAYQSGDRFGWGRVRDTHVEEVEPGVITFHGLGPYIPQVGNIVALRFGRRENPAFFINGGAHINFDTICVHHAPGMGLIAQKCDSIHLHRFEVKLREGSGRIVSATADATHFVYCRGLIRIEHCLFENQLDDPCNIHGIYAKITERLRDDQLLIELAHGMAKGIEIAGSGDEFSFVSHESLQAYSSASVKDVRYLNKDYMIITFDQPLSDRVRINDVVENLSWSPDVIITHNIIRANRARGLLLTTSGDILVEHNKISVPGSGIKVSGDANSWFESGAVKQLSIRHNEFIDCNYCCPDWGRAVIDIDPEIEIPEQFEGYYHRNISIEHNRFVAFDTGIVYGLSVDGLTFAHNVIENSSTYEPHHVMQYPIELKASKNVNMEGNHFATGKLTIAKINDQEVDIS